MERVASLIAAATVLFPFNSFLLAQPKLLPSPTGKVPLTEVRICDKQPKWSPDGKQIAFLSNRVKLDERYFELYLMSPGGTNLQTVHMPPNTIDIRSFCWSPDGEHIAFVGRQGVEKKYIKNVDIFVINTHGTGLRNFTNKSDFSYDQLQWSPDNSKIAFVRVENKRSSKKEIWILGTNGEFWYKLVDGTNPIWSPNSKQLLLFQRISPLVGGVGFVQIDIDGKNQQMFKMINRYKNGRYDFGSPGNVYWSSDGSKIFADVGADWIVIRSTKSNENWKLVTDVSKHEVIGSDRLRPRRRSRSRKEAVKRRKELIKGRKELEERYRYGLRSVLSPTGKDIVFIANGDIWKVDATSCYDFGWGRNIVKRPFRGHNLTNSKEKEEASPRWSPHGKKIVYVRDYEIWVMNADGSEQTQLTFERTRAIAKAKGQQAEAKAARERALKEVVREK